MSRHKWGIFWLVMLGWNAVSLGNHLSQDRWGRAAFDLLVTVWMGVMAYRDLTKARVGDVTITITPDSRAFDAAMKQATWIIRRPKL